MVFTKANKGHDVYIVEIEQTNHCEKISLLVKYLVGSDEYQMEVLVVNRIIGGIRTLTMGFDEGLYVAVDNNYPVIDIIHSTLRGYINGENIILPIKIGNTTDVYA